MSNTILVPLDGSPLAACALPVAGALARATGGQLRLLRAVWPATMLGVDPTATQIEEIATAEAYLSTQARELTSQGVPTETTVIFGATIGAITEEATLRDAQLIVLATHGRSGLGGWIMGSTAAALLAKSPVPVLLVRAWHAQRAIERLSEGARIIVTLDGSSTAEEALPSAERLATVLGGELILLQIIPPADPALTPDGMAIALFHVDPAEQLALARDYLDHVAGQLAAREFAVRCEVRIGDPATVIDAIGREHGAALIVMATHGRTGLDRVLLGSVAEAVVHRGTIPTLLVRSGMQMPAAAVERGATPERSA